MTPENEMQLRRDAATTATALTTFANLENPLDAADVALAVAFVEGFLKRLSAAAEEKAGF